MLKDVLLYSYFEGDGLLSSLIMKVRGSAFSVPVKTQYGGI
jgi:hypothetical protein